MIKQLSAILREQELIICESIEGKCLIKTSYTVQCSCQNQLYSSDCVYFPTDICMSMYMIKERWILIWFYKFYLSAIIIQFTSKHFPFFFISTLKDFFAYHFYTRLICSIARMHFHCTCITNMTCPTTRIPIKKVMNFFAQSDCSLFIPPANEVQGGI